MVLSRCLNSFNMSLDEAVRPWDSVGRGGDMV